MISSQTFSVKDEMYLGLEKYIYEAHRINKKNE